MAIPAGHARKANNEACVCILERVHHYSVLYAPPNNLHKLLHDRFGRFLRDIVNARYVNRMRLKAKEYLTQIAGIIIEDGGVP